MGTAVQWEEPGSRVQTRIQASAWLCVLALCGRTDAFVWPAVSLAPLEKRNILAASGRFLLLVGR